ncbi:MAG: TlpA disulfide reductase family protein [Pseudomonadota bacterium]
MKTSHLFAYGAIALLFGTSGALVASKQAAAPERKVAPAGVTGPVQALFGQRLDDASGKPQALSQWRGKPLLVNFWAPWCAPCVQEMPELSSLQNEAAGKNLQIIGIGIDSPSNIAQFTQRLKISYPIYVAGMSGTDLSRQFGNQAGGLPYTVLIGADGQVKKTYLGRLQFDQLRKDLAAL